jgi:hypothetical protein
MTDLEIFDEASRFAAMTDSGGWYFRTDGSLLEFAYTITNGEPPKRDSLSWVGLTKDEVDSWELPDCPTVFEFCQFIEAKLKEKNT